MRQVIKTREQMTDYTVSSPSETEIQQLLDKCDEQISSATDLLEEASDICGKVGESVVSELSNVNSGTTAGHSNTDHIIVWTNDDETNKIAELKRNMIQRMRARQPECRGEDRWDKPRVFGERRRRIFRDRDAPEAPPEPPSAGYVVFVCQMTAKIRHDRPNVPHNQTAVVQEISKIWRIGLSDADREFYTNFSEEARKEYELQHLEYRATGAFRPSRKFERVEGTGPWIHARPEDRNDLEREISRYTTVQFPPRPPELDEAYERRLIESRRRRKLKQKGLLNPDGTERSEPLPDPLGTRRKRRRRRIDKDAVAVSNKEDHGRMVHDVQLTESNDAAEYEAETHSNEQQDTTDRSTAATQTIDP